MINQGTIISYLTMCQLEGTNLQRGMNFKLKGGDSVVLMSTRSGSPYSDKVEEEGKVLIYEGHDIPKTKEIDDPKKYDQQEKTPNGQLTQNGKFYNAAIDYKIGLKNAELVKVYEKIKSGIWVFNGIFKLVDAWKEKSGERLVFKFKLNLLDEEEDKEITPLDLPHNRMIPSSVKLEVWRRDKGKCQLCHSQDNLHFDHIIPFSKGGSSLTAENIQLLCARHNLQKSNRIQ